MVTGHPFLAEDPLDRRPRRRWCGAGRADRGRLFVSSGQRRRLVNTGMSAAVVVRVLGSHRVHTVSA